MLTNLVTIAYKNFVVAFLSTFLKGVYTALFDITQQDLVVNRSTLETGKLRTLWTPCC